MTNACLLTGPGGCHPLVLHFSVLSLLAGDGLQPLLERLVASLLFSQNALIIGFCLFRRGPRMRQLRSHVHPVVEARWQRPLPVQRLWPLLQNEWSEQAADQAQEEAGECLVSLSN